MLDQRVRCDVVKNHPAPRREKKGVSAALATVATLLVISVSSASASEPPQTDSIVLRVIASDRRLIISHPADLPWKVTDLGCVQTVPVIEPKVNCESTPENLSTDVSCRPVSGEKETEVCGHILLTGTCGAVLQLAPQTDITLELGAKVKLRTQEATAPQPLPLSELEMIPLMKTLSAPCEILPTQLTDAAPATTPPPPPTPKAKYYAGAGANFQSPLVRIDMLEDNLAYGLTLSLSTFYQVRLFQPSSQTRASLWIILPHIEYFLTSQFEGTFARFAMGYAGGTVELVGYQFSIYGGTIASSIGYRKTWDSFSAAASLGAQYFYVRNADTVVQVLSPSLVLEAGGLF